MFYSIFYLMDINKVKSFFKSHNIVLLSKEVKNNKSPIYFLCPICGKESHSTWTSLSRKSDSKLILCKECALNKKREWGIQRFRDKDKIDEIRREFASRGATLISDEYINCSQNLVFLCSKCGKEHTISYSSFKRGINPNLTCLDCSKIARPDIQKIAEDFKSKGATLLTTDAEYKNKNTKLRFLCSNCGNEYSIIYANYQQGQNPRLLCDQCMVGHKSSPDAKFGNYRQRIDNNWYNWVKGFFNIPREQFNQYSAHHIIPYAISEEFRHSILNGFPLRKEIHSNSYISPSGIRNPYHTPDFMDVSNWGEEARLHYHTYPNFKFHDFNKFLVMDVYPTNSSTSRNEYLSKKKSYNEQGKLYIPVYYEELFYDVKREIIYSMLRNRLYRNFPDIYAYTGSTLTRFYARKLTLQKVPYGEVSQFLKYNHIQGEYRSPINFVLKYNNNIVAAMTFGKARDNKHQYELLRYAVATNTTVIGGAAKLFSAFIKEYHPESVLSYCDIRFSDLNPDNTVYTRLGFKLDHISQPNFKYLDLNTKRLFTRQHFMKHKLPGLLDNFDPELSEEQNMLNNGYVRQYDCGNYVFVWKNEVKGSK